LQSSDDQAFVVPDDTTSSRADWPRSRRQAVLPVLLTWIVRCGCTPGAYVLASVWARTRMAELGQVGTAVADGDPLADAECDADGVVEAECVAGTELVCAAGVDEALVGGVLDAAVGLPLPPPSRPKSHQPPATTATRSTRTSSRRSQ
jgi:hypothetical protein